MPAWLHERAEHLLARNPDMKKSTAFAVATQQSHATGHTPKGYGTSTGKREAKAKYDTPKGDEQRANPGGLTTPKLSDKPKTVWKGGHLEKKAWRDQLPGGLSDDKKPKDFSSSALRAGRSAESEHTKSKHLQTEIAMDHLTEDPKYYEKLRKMEKKAVSADWVFKKTTDAAKKLPRKQLLERADAIREYLAGPHAPGLGHWGKRDAMADALENVAHLNVEKKAMDEVIVDAFFDELQKISACMKEKDSGFLDRMFNPNASFSGAIGGTAGAKPSAAPTPAPGMPAPATRKPLPSGPLNPGGGSLLYAPKAQPPMPTMTAGRARAANAALGFHG